MKTILKQGALSSYRQSVRLNEALGPIPQFSYFTAMDKVSVFMSHKHSDLADLEGVIGLLESTYAVKIYIDSRDSSMPPVTSGETATRLKERIRMCKKFILLATNDAIESKWCNWELGFGDAQKYNEHIALFPLNPSSGKYEGSEYMKIYPYIARFDGYETTQSGTPIRAGYNVCVDSDTGIARATPFGEWLKR